MAPRKRNGRAHAFLLSSINSIYLCCHPARWQVSMEAVCLRCRSHLVHKFILHRQRRAHLRHRIHRLGVRTPERFLEKPVNKTIAGPNSAVRHDSRDDSSGSPRAVLEWPAVPDPELIGALNWVATAMERLADEMSQDRTNHEASAKFPWWKRLIRLD